MTQETLELLIRAAPPGAVITVVTIANPERHSEGGAVVGIGPRPGEDRRDIRAGEPDAVLTLEASALESGYSVDHLGRMVREGKIPNAGRKHSPAIRRRDLPKKPGVGKDKVARKPDAGDRDAGLFRDIINLKGGG